MSHLTDSERLQIEHELRREISLPQIARGLGKSHITISREVLKHRVDSDKGTVGRITNAAFFVEIARFIICAPVADVKGSVAPVVTATRFVRSFMKMSAENYPFRPMSALDVPRRTNVF